MQRIVLLVEDAENWKDTITHILEDEGYKVICASERKEARKVIDSLQNKPDVIIVNLNLYSDNPPDGIGYEILENLEQTHPTLPKIVLSAIPKPSKVSELYLRYNVTHVEVKGEDFSRQNLLFALHKAKVIKEKVVMSEEYIDFDLYVGTDGQVKAYSEYGGERTNRISLDIPSDVRTIARLIEKDETDEELLTDFGKRLYEIIFPEAINTHFNSTEAVAKTKDRKTRIRFNIEPDSLAMLPWEFTYRDEGGYFLSVNPQTVLSRYLNLPLPPDRVRRREEPLNMLVIIANPNDQIPLDPDEWEQIIIDALEEPINEEKIQLYTIKNAIRREISNVLLKQKPDIVQFVGHGIYENGKGYLALVDERTGGTWELDDARFANIFLGADENLGLVSLATCESAKSDSPQGFLGIAPQIVQRGVPAVVAMRYTVLIRTAKVFLEEFYKAVAARKPVDWAVQWARNQVSIEYGLDNREFATPVLFMRAKEGNIF